MNTFTSLLTYLIRCNSDVTSLLSGTAIKAVISYVTDYITKSPLKTYTIFDAVRSIFDKNSEFLNGSSSQKEKARLILTKIVNSLTGKMEIGAPMACAYLLGHKDHYTSHRFEPFSWKSFVREAMRPWHPDNNDNIVGFTDKVTVRKSEDGKYIGISPVFDYIYRPKIYEDVNLYDWIRRSRKKAMSKKRKEELKELQNEEENERNIHIKDEEDNDTQFAAEHPQSKTHEVKLVKEKFGVVPNFIGGQPPRKDQGNREYYCATM
ncbi:hypothetical protein BD410DRAFT_723883, partial [Rickenella mellea]